VLGVSLIVMTLAVAGIMSARVQARSADANGDAATARLGAQAGLELARLWIAKDPNWRSNRSSGAWASNLDIGGASVSVSVLDLIDGNLGNRPHDPVQITASGTKGQAIQVLQTTLNASPTPMPVLQYAMAVGPTRVRSGGKLVLGSSTLSINGSLRNESVIEGSVECQSVTSAGTIHGQLTSGVAAKTIPGSGISESYASLGTLVSASALTKKVLSGGVNPTGAANSDGVYVVRTSSDLTIKNCRIDGTLVIICPGKRVTIEGAVLFQPARADYPSLIIHGDAEFKFTGGAGALSESAQGVNFNPPGAPYNGETDGDMTDVYPSEIRGLVHVTGAVKVSAPGIIRGALISGGTSGDSVEIDTSTFQVIHDASVFANPPQFYTTSVPMPQVAGSIRQVVN
jgi:hypothetical protein